MNSSIYSDCLIVNEEEQITSEDEDLKDIANCLNCLVTKVVQSTTVQKVSSQELNRNMTGDLPTTFEDNNSPRNQLINDLNELTNKMDDFAALEEVLIQFDRLEEDSCSYNKACTSSEISIVPSELDDYDDDHDSIVSEVSQFSEDEHLTYADLSSNYVNPLLDNFQNNLPNTDELTTTIIVPPSEETLTASDSNLTANSFSGLMDFEQSSNDIQFDDDVESSINEMFTDNRLLDYINEVLAQDEVTSSELNNQSSSSTNQNSDLEQFIFGDLNTQSEEVGCSDFHNNCPSPSFDFQNDLIIEQPSNVQQASMSSLNTLPEQESYEYELESPQSSQSPPDETYDDDEYKPEGKGQFSDFLYYQGVEIEPISHRLRPRRCKSRYLEEDALLYMNTQENMLKFWSENVKQRKPFQYKSQPSPPKKPFNFH